MARDIWCTVCKTLTNHTATMHEDKQPLKHDDFFLQMAELTATRSTCLRGNVGAVIARDGRPVSMGYNGAPPGQPHCTDVGCDELTLYTMEKGVAFIADVEPVELGCQRATHAELNAIVWAARSGVSTADCTMYCTHSPCDTCARLIIVSGIVRVVYRKHYRREALHLLEAAGIDHLHLP